MHYYLALTSKCNLLCKYCYGKSVEDFLTDEESIKYDFNLPDEINFTIDELNKFAKTDKNFTLTFYGGEPLLKINLIKEIMDNVQAKEFMMQTNGVFLHKLESKYLNKLSTILVSIDGTLEHTNERRGNKIYEKVINNIKLIRNNGYKNELIARMTVDETCDIFENVTHLLSIKEFNSVHWQIDAGFWKSDYEQRDFTNWHKKYNQGITELIDYWIKRIEDEKKVPRIYPFAVLVYDLIKENKAPMRCGAGHSCLGIQTNGKVVACPITAGFRPLYMGDLREDNYNKILTNKIDVDGWCTNCEIKDICGGRCLYWNKSDLWPKQGREEICATIFHLVKTLQKQIPKIKELIEKKEINIEDFNLPRYNGVEVIP